jgi:phosphonate transport system permease protein
VFSLFNVAFDFAPVGLLQPYRWENNIRAAAVLGVVGAGGLGQMLSFHMSLFQMEETSSVLLAVILLVILVDSISYLFRNALTR